MLHIIKEHHIDQGELDPNGYYEYYYEYDLYYFSSNVSATSSLVVRHYVNENTAHFLRKEWFGNSKSLESQDLSSTLIIEAIDYLKSLGISNFDYLSVGGYKPIELKINS